MYANLPQERDEQIVTCWHRVVCIVKNWVLELELANPAPLPRDKIKLKSEHVSSLVTHTHCLVQSLASH